MYKLKTLGVNHLQNSIEVEEGIQIAYLNEKKSFIPYNEYWGTSQIHIEEYVDKQKFNKTKDDFILINYVNEYKVEDWKNDGYKKLFLNIGNENKEIDGYIIFIPSSSNCIKTNGEILFQRYPNEIIAVLKNGNYLSFSNKIIKVLENELVIVI